MGADFFFTRLSRMKSTRRMKKTKSLKKTRRLSRRRVRKQRGGMLNFNSLSTNNRRRAVIDFLDGGDVDSVRTLMSSENADKITE